ncbi:hypothetical protein Zmor_012088 [Zophobas morio]|uniref:Uncharacterized protein n=1 Tax=Zophobas morio TaxID=2755281 RepID=A0AA38LYJ1_9CUCU|nr:hypothetical protein Zmor_012088 [Zophobas morio]
MNELLGEINHIAAQKKYNHLTHFVIRTFKLFHPIRDHDVIKINKNLNISDDEFELRRTEPFKSYAYLEGSEVEEKIVGIVSLPDSILFHRRRIKQPYEGGIKYNLWLRTDSKVIKFLNCYGNRYDPFKEVNCIGPLYTSGYALLLYKYPTFALPLFDEHERLLKNNKYKIDNALNSNHLNETSDNIAAQANDIFNCMWNKIYPYQVNQGDPSYVIYRIYGNDLPPLQKVGQLAQNLKYTLENENKNLIGLTKRWVLNRIIDKDLEEKMLNMLQEHGYTEENGSVLVFRFDNITFKSLLSVPGSTKNLYQLNGCNPKYLEKAKKNIKILVNYAQHLNEVRNILLKHARNLVTEEPNILADTSQRMFDWILIFDGNQFITNEGWQEINSFTKYRKYRNTKVFQVPMCRIKQPQEVKWLNENSTLDNLLEQDICIMQEPQLMFRYDACMTFNLENEYGKKSKLQLLNSLGCDEPSSSSAIYCGTAGYSLRLFPFPDIESPGDAVNVITSHSKRYRLRKTAIEAFALKLWELFIALYHDKNCYNTTS